jgi:NAD(P)-dependent dehydrogenase (short-subunit alcohol dehydrogenase family)
MTLEGKAFVVAGAAGRIGHAIVAAAMEQGASVLAVDHDEAALQRLASQLSPKAGQLLLRRGDIGAADQIAQLLGHAANQFGRLDGAVNTAYPRNANYGRKFLEVTATDFNENLGLHLGGYFIFMQQCVKFASQSNAAFSLVSLSSIYGVMAPRFDVYAGTAMTMPVEYAAIKSALIHLTRYACSYAKGTAFRANCVSPGGISAGQDGAFLDRYRSHCQNKGMLDANDPIGAVLFLLSEESRYIVGQNLVVDDGFSL